MFSTVSNFEASPGVVLFEKVANGGLKLLQANSKRKKSLLAIL